MAEEKEDSVSRRGEKVEPPEERRGLLSPHWVARTPALRLVHGVWAPGAPPVPLSSSARAGERKPASMREKREREEKRRSEPGHAGAPPAG